MRRLLVTGSRQASSDYVYKALSMYQVQYGKFTLVHGACPDGADYYAHIWYEWALTHFLDKKVIEEKYPADWNAYGKGAGHKRNQYMVDLGADDCYAFPTICVRVPCIGKPAHYSHGTLHCMKAARKAKIPVSLFGQQDLTLPW